MQALLSAGLFPIISRLVQEKDGWRIRLVTEKSLAAAFLMALPLAAGGIIVARPLLELLFGSVYAEATPAFQLLLSTVLLVFPGALIANTIFAHDAQKAFIASTALGAGANVLFDYLLIPPYGITGSAVATVIALLLTVGTNWIKLRRIVPLAPWPHLPRIAAATLLMSAVTALVAFAGAPVLVNVALSAALYLATLFVLREPLLTAILRRQDPLH